MKVEKNTHLKIIESYIVPFDTPLGYRLSDYLPLVFKTIPSKKGLKKAIKKGLVLVNGQVGHTGLWIEPGMVIDLVEEPIPISNPGFNFPIKILYEDDYLAVIVKPSGILVNGNAFQTVENAIQSQLKRSEQLDALARFRPVHRLDRATSGLLIIAKTSRAILSLSKQFELKQIKKTYRAIVIGKMPEFGTINLPVEDKPATTKYCRVQSTRSLKNGWLSDVLLYPETGRTHQLRIHLFKMGYPILGDALYYNEGFLLKGKGLFLSAVQITFYHPIYLKNETIIHKAPNKFDLFLKKEEQRYYKFNTL